MEVTRSVQMCIKSIRKNVGKGLLKDEASRLYYAAGYLEEVPEVSELLGTIIGNGNSHAGGAYLPPENKKRQQ